MRSSAAWLLAAALLGTGAARAQDGPPAAASAPAVAVDPDRPSRDAIEAELATLRKDPRFGGTKTEKTWRLKPREPDQAKPPERGGMPGWLAWLRDFVGWVTSVGRVVVWAVGALLVALLLVGLRHWIRERAGAAPQRPAALPSHVRDLDIRPESLPADIGATASAMWLRGEHRAALSLLYRGALSRLVHAHQLPIRAASTEGECVALARRALRPVGADYVARLVAAWQLAVYGGRLPETPAVVQLCNEFDGLLGVPSPGAAA